MKTASSVNLPGELTPSPTEYEESLRNIEVPASSLIPPKQKVETTNQPELQKAIEKSSQQIIEQIAWEVIPDLAEVLLKQRIQETAEQMVQEVVNKIGPEIVEKVAWEVVPDLAEAAIKNRGIGATASQTPGKNSETASKDMVEQIVLEVVSSLIEEIAFKKRISPSDA